MKTNLKLILQIQLNILFIPLLAVQPSDSLMNKIKELSFKLNASNYAYSQENIYLHVDRESYWANDDIWFKAYLRSPEEINNVYVELINSSGSIIQKKMYLSQFGISYGDIHLPDTISSGVYQLRAYTNWMRNFEEDGFFHKNFIVWNLKDKVIETKTQSVKAKSIDVQFFPEGGTLLAGISGKFGFKAIDEKGIGMSINGMVVDKNGKTITNFKSEFKGMGSFSFQPELGMKYTAIVNVFGKTKQFKLPMAETEGVSLSIETNQTENLQLKVYKQSAEKESNPMYYLLGQIRGISIFCQPIDLSSGFSELNFSKMKIPTGVLQVTLFDSNLIPKCERLTFINHNEYIHVDLKTNKKTYFTREKVEVSINTLTIDSLPIVSNLSFSAYTLNSHLKLEENPNNILSQFLFIADLKGRIEEPGYYFKNQQPETLSALDNLMLTQGWRKFKWKTILGNDQPLIISYPHESSISVRGKVITKFFDMPLSNRVVSLFFSNKNYLYYQQTSDSLGQFLFDNFYFLDEEPVLLMAKTEKGNKNNWIEIDDRSQKSPETTMLPVDYLLESDKKVNTTYQIGISNSDMISQKWHVTDTILLADIDIYGQKRKDENKNSFLLYTMNDFSLKIKEEDKTAADIFDLIQYRIPGVNIRYNGGTTPSIRVRGSQKPPLLLLDGFPIEISTLQSMSVSSFDKVELLNNASIYGSKGAYGEILFTSAANEGNNDAELAWGMKSKYIMGYSVLREFYSPKYHKEKHSIKKTDFRSTLYWKPNLWTDGNGKESVAFYNSDQPGEIQIVVEGFTTDGRICRGTTSYNVKP